MSCPLSELRLFFGEVSEHTARVYAELERPGGDGEYSLSGKIRGPFSRQGATLPACTTLHDRPGKSLLCAAVVPDPCFWTSDLPATYTVTIELQDGPTKLASIDRQFAFRPLGARGESFYFSNRRWVMRCIEPVDYDAGMMSQWRDAETTLLVSRLDVEFLKQASQSGVRVLLDCRGETQLKPVLLGASQHAAVIGAILDASTVEQQSLAPRFWTRNLLLLSEPVRRAESTSSMPDWADALWISAAELQADGPNRHRVTPKVVYQADLDAGFDRNADIDRNDAGRRAAVDRLQAQLAMLGQFAGYAVVASASR